MISFGGKILNDCGLYYYRRYSKAPHLYHVGVILRSLRFGENDYWYKRMLYSLSHGKSTFGMFT